MDALDPSEVEHLYSEPLDRFIDARTELVKRLREQGSGDAAAEAGRLRKPTVPAWAVDQLARLAPEDLGGFGRLLGAPEAGEEPSEPGSPRRDAKARRGAQDRRKKIDAAERQAERLKAAAEEATAIARAAADHATEVERAAAALRKD